MPIPGIDSSNGGHITTATLQKSYIHGLDYGKLRFRRNSECEHPQGSLDVVRVPSRFMHTHYEDGAAVPTMIGFTIADSYIDFEVPPLLYGGVYEVCRCVDHRADKFTRCQLIDRFTLNGLSNLTGTGAVVAEVAGAAERKHATAGLATQLVVHGFGLTMMSIMHPSVTTPDVFVVPFQEQCSNVVFESEHDQRIRLPEPEILDEFLLSVHRYNSERLAHITQVTWRFNDLIFSAGDWSICWYCGLDQLLNPQICYLGNFTVEGPIHVSNYHLHLRSPFSHATPTISGRLQSDFQISITGKIDPGVDQFKIIKNNTVLRGSLQESDILAPDEFTWSYVGNAYRDNLFLYELTIENPGQYRLCYCRPVFPVQDCSTLQNFETYVASAFSVTGPVGIYNLYHEPIEAMAGKPFDLLIDFHGSPSEFDFAPHLCIRRSCESPLDINNELVTSAAFQYDFPPRVGSDFIVFTAVVVPLGGPAEVCYCENIAADSTTSCKQIGGSDFSFVSVGKSQALEVGRTMDEGIPISGVDLQASIIGYRFLSSFDVAFVQADNAISAGIAPRCDVSSGSRVSVGVTVTEHDCVAEFGNVPRQKAHFNMHSLAAGYYMLCFVMSDSNHGFAAYMGSFVVNGPHLVSTIQDGPLDPYGVLTAGLRFDLTLRGLGLSTADRIHVVPSKKNSQSSCGADMERLSSENSGIDVQANPEIVAGTNGDVISRFSANFKTFGVFSICWCGGSLGLDCTDDSNFLSPATQGQFNVFKKENYLECNKTNLHIFIIGGKEIFMSKH